MKPELFNNLNIDQLKTLKGIVIQWIDEGFVKHFTPTHYDIFEALGIDQDDVWYDIKRPTDD
jgi:hypothetical protein